MEFTKKLREGVRRGDITCSVRFWMQPRVKRGRYRMGDGQIEVDSIQLIEFDDITPELARESGFASVVDLLKTAKHGRGTNIYLVRFHYVPARASRAKRAASQGRSTGKSRSERQRAKILRLIADLPEATAVARGTHLSLEVRKRRFGYFLDDHHGDGRVALNCKGSPDLRETLQQLAPAQFHIPKYLGAKGWVGLWLDDADLDWSLVGLVLREAYQLTAPKTLARALALSV
jgi:predicted DNA-binding protein (MmcQ/YjbR family)